VSLPVSGIYGIRYYVDYPVTSPIARFVFITPGVVGSISSYNTYRAGETGYKWVSSVLDEAISKGMWTIVIMHKNYISVMIKHDEVGPDLMHLLFSKPVDVVLQGHEHGYERSAQLSCAVVGEFKRSCVVDGGDTLTRGAGTVIVVVGTGGQSLRGVNGSDPEWGYFRVVNNVSYGFTHFEVNETFLRNHYIHLDCGPLSDSFVIQTNHSFHHPAFTLGPTATSGPTATAHQYNGAGQLFGDVFLCTVLLFIVGF